MRAWIDALCVRVRELDGPPRVFTKPEDVGRAVRSAMWEPVY